jgi:hypothetical protein
MAARRDGGGDWATRLKASLLHAPAAPSPAAEPLPPESPPETPAAPAPDSEPAAAASRPVEAEEGGARPVPATTLLAALAQPRSPEPPGESAAPPEPRQEAPPPPPVFGLLAALSVPAEPEEARPPGPAPAPERPAEAEASPPAYSLLAALTGPGDASPAPAPPVEGDPPPAFPLLAALTLPAKPAPAEPPEAAQPLSRPSLLEVISAPAAAGLLRALSSPPPSPPIPGLLGQAAHRPAGPHPPAEEAAPEPAERPPVASAPAEATPPADPPPAESPAAEPSPPPPPEPAAEPSGNTPQPRGSPAREPVFDPADLASLDALGAGARAEPGMVVDWFGLRTPAALAPELKARHGRVLHRPVPRDPRAPAADWVGMVHSVATAVGHWRAIAFGAGRGDLLLAGALAARRRGLAVQLHATEADPARFAALLQHAEANGLDPAMQEFRQAEIGAAPSNPPPRGDTVQEMLAGGPRWDWVRVSLRGAVAPLLAASLPMLAERARVLALSTFDRVEEAAAVESLATAGWHLVAETGCSLSRTDPRRATRPGAQAWRSPIA